MTKNRNTVIGLVSAIALSLAFAGCQSKEEALRSNPPPINVDAQIKAIQNNPNMPQSAKDQAIGIIRAQNAKSAAANASASKK